MNEQTEQVKQGTIIYPEVEALRWTIQQQRDELEKLRAENKTIREAAAVLREALVMANSYVLPKRGGILNNVIARYDEMMKGGE